ncbi:hypothetical protein P168DRAFT_326114 [Aspergillus campestris IBT 28561]|uniref:BZIP domain-containing protein n=1 Tax=Aspergillus campestris (strain IBT 28561) TaxID=1392248 RepID=A0A2I1D7F6_ASPC2|nr:uncharacterized protein P168DRAFT_326114 [Aspergillus campestris IBT 28561]PKY05805.1 hypothetical protein P168DRAFT_326114 [Aspergillus campestris IBT 28561]
MDYSYYSNPQSQQYPPFYGFNGAAPPDQNNQISSPDDIQETLASLNYQTFDPSFQPPAGSYALPPQSPPESFSKQSTSSNDFRNSHTELTSLDGTEDQAGGLGPSSSEEKDTSMPAQTKRKAQNRAAQRAFRERKERHVRDLEDKVTTLQDKSSAILAENERLKHDLARFSTENEILRATSRQSLDARDPSRPSPPPTATTTGPMQYRPTDFSSDGGADGEDASPRHRIAVCKITGERLLDAGATWDFIQKHELFKKGLVDIEAISGRLKGMAQCDGQGPAFAVGAVRKAIEEVAAEGKDDLI